MRPPTRVSQVREEAIALRLAGKSVREIRDALGPVGKRTLSTALKDTPPAEWTLRPNAKDDLRDQARALRTKGLSYNEIVTELGVSKSSVSLWVRDIPARSGSPTCTASGARKGSGGSTRPGRLGMRRKPRSRPSRLAN